MKKIFIHILLFACCLGLTTCKPEFTWSDVFFTVEVQPNDAALGSVTGSGKYHYKKEITLSATPITTNYEFIAWSDGNVDNPRKIVVSRDTTLIAMFAIPTENEHEYINLGLPSGTLWATCNVGATSPEAYGDYFSWGETTPKSTYNWSTYKYCNGSVTTLTKYCTEAKYGVTDGKTTLEPEDDAATANWGGRWRTPTAAEFQELIDKCEWISTKSGYYIYGPKGNDIFLPLAGFYDDSSLKSLGGYGCYLSSLLYDNIPSAIYIFECKSGAYTMRTAYRYHGNSVRPVFSIGPMMYTITLEADAAMGSVTGAGTYEAGETATLTATANEGYKFTGWSDGNRDNPRTIVVAGDVTLTAIFAEVVQIDGHEYVDLGLPSGTLWATCNVGATAPEEYGDYFAWGEVKPKSDYSWGTYNYGSASNQLTKYCTNSTYGKDGFIDNKTVLDPSDDAATVNWGEKWRTPIEAEWKELMSECTWKWTDNYENTGVVGHTVTGKNGKSIFLPAAGCCHGGTNFSNVGSDGYYWSSSLYTSNPNTAPRLTFGSVGPIWFRDNRSDGQSIRPVVNSETKKYYTITVESDATMGLVTGAGTYAEGETATLTATANEGYKFTGWNDGNGDNPRKLVVTGDITLTAIFEELTKWYTITVEADATMGSVTGAGAYEEGSTATLTATANDSYVFAGWSDGNTDNPRTIVVTGDVTLTAIFEELPKIDGHAYVDLGLPSGTLWATCNVGANKPEEYGDYFAWGETASKSNYSGSTYKYRDVGSNWAALTKYCTTNSYGTVDNKTVLEAADDVATVHWGGAWRMPTTAEQQELLNECIWSWTTRNSVNGYNVTGSNGNSIFLPAAGYRNELNLDGVGSSGCYWSSSLWDNYPPRAYHLYFTGSYLNWEWSYHDRYYGHSVRPVCSPQ